jgi:hypothetical protein
MGLYAGVDYNLPLCRFQSRQSTPTQVRHGQPYARVDFIPSQGLRIWPLLENENFDAIKSTIGP